MAPAKPAILLSHGAYQRPAHYEPVLGALRARGYTVAAPALPTTGTDPDATCAEDMAAIDALVGPWLDDGREVILVAHSMGSIPASQYAEGRTVAERAERGPGLGGGGGGGGIRHYVNVCGLSFPQRGRDLMGNTGEFAFQGYHELHNGLVRLGEGAKPIFYSDLTTEQADEAWSAAVRTHSLKNFNGFPGYIDTEIRAPKTYVLGEHDIALPTQFQEYFTGVGRYEEVIRLPSGHFPFIQMPDRMVEIITEIAERSSG